MHPKNAPLRVPLSILFLAFHMVICGVSFAHAQAEPGFFVRGDLGVHRLSQNDDAPPICCGERDTWSSWGPMARLGIGWRFGWMALRLDSMFATGSADTDVGEGDLHRFGLSLGSDIYIGTGAVQGVVGAGLNALSASGTIDDYEADKTVVGFHLGAGVRWQWHPALALAVDGRVLAYLFSNGGVELTAGVIYSAF